MTEPNDKPSARRRWRPRFTLRTLLIVSVIAALLFATVQARLETREANEHLDFVLEAFGWWRSPDGESDNLEVRRLLPVELAYNPSSKAYEPLSAACYLFRVENFTQYEFEFVFYDGAADEVDVERLAMHSPVYYLSYTQEKDVGVFDLQSNVFGREWRPPPSMTYRTECESSAVFVQKVHAPLSVPNTLLLYGHFLPSDHESGVNSRSLFPEVENVNREAELQQLLDELKKRKLSGFYVRLVEKQTSK